MRCFVIMPFAQEFDDVYAVIKSAVTTSVPGESIECFRLDEIKGVGRITDDLIRELSRATVCIADITDNNPNVMWEVGYTMALKKPLLFVTQRIDKLPFDIKDMRTIPYNRQSLTQTLATKLSDAFRNTLGTYEVRREITRLGPTKDADSTIAITGSMEGDSARCARRIETTLAPYLSDHVTWLCGSFGLVDELVIKFLADHSQKIVVVGYHSYDISDSVLALINQHSIEFLDALKEQVPKGIAAPSERDLLFLTKADLVVLLWNGKSQGTKEMIRWYSQHQKDHVIAFF